MVGPSYDYNDHEDFIYRKGDYAETPRTFLPSLAYLLSSFFALAIVVSFSERYNHKLAISSEFAEKGWLDKYLTVTILELVHRFKYFTAWLMATANVTAPGLNHNPKGKGYFERYGKIVAVRPLDYERGDNIRDKLEVKCFIFRDVNVHIKGLEHPNSNLAQGLCVFENCFRGGSKTESLKSYPC